MLTTYPRIGEEVQEFTLPNGLPVCIVPKRGFQRKYAMFATRYGGMDMRFEKDGRWLDTPAGIAHYLEHKMFDTAEGNALQELAKKRCRAQRFHLQRHHLLLFRLYRKVHGKPADPAFFCVHPLLHR